MKIEYVKLDGIEYRDLARYAELLPPERRDKIARLRYDSDKLLSLAAGLLIRMAAGDRPILLNEYGKPYVEGGDVFFSVSHSGRCAAIAVESAEVGLDVEKLPERDVTKIAQRCFHPDELEALTDARDFARIWTRKEAYIKLRGTGLSDELREINTLSPELSARMVTCDLDGYALTVCSYRNITENDIDISELELKDIIKG